MRKYFKTDKSEFKYFFRHNIEYRILIKELLFVSLSLEFSLSRQIGPTKRYLFFPFDRFIFTSNVCVYILILIQGLIVQQIGNS